ncbi:hypothetical protein LSAT2_029555 [Lamellibrachia satsuma]|nr:hypothetical protein LSAT2_029555 [Lamellibrachia satsuma]
MTEITKNGNRGIRWTLTLILEDLDYADDIGLLSSRHKDMQEKMDKLTTTTPQIGLKLNTAKTKLMRINYKTYNPITINNINNSDALRNILGHTDKEEKMEMAWTRVPNVTWLTAQDSLTLDSRCKHVIYKGANLADEEKSQRLKNQEFVIDGSNRTLHFMLEHWPHPSCCNLEDGDVKENGSEPGRGREQPAIEQSKVSSRISSWQTWRAHARRSS